MQIPQTNRFFVLLLALFVSVAFHNCLQNDFIGDDKALFANNQFYKNLNSFPKIFSRALVMDPSHFEASRKVEFFSGCISYRPVVAATFFFDFALWKENPLGHHFNNMLLHFLASVLVFYLILRISGNSKIAFLTASLFAVHPIQSEVVNASGYRSDILMAIFTLSAILAYLRYSAAPKKWKWFFVTAASYFFALFSKETALTFPFVIVLIEHFFLAGKGIRQALGERKFLFLMLAAISVFYLYVYFVRIPNAFYLQPAPLALKGLAQVVLMLKIFAQYIFAFLFPWEVSVLPPLYAPPVFPLNFLDIFLPLYVVLFLVGIGFYFYRRNKIVTFGLVWFFVNYLPTSGIFPLLNPIAFRFLYLPSIGLFLFAAVLIEFVANRIDQKNFVLNISFLFQSALIGLLIALTVANNTFFKNNFVACREMIRRYPNSSRPYWILGLDSYLAGNYLQAVQYLKQHLTVDLNNPFISSDKEKFLTYHLLGLASVDPDVAIGYLMKAVKLSPGFAEVYLDLSKRYISKKDYPTALSYAKHASALNPQSVLAYVYIVHINVENQNLSEARAVLSEAQKKFGGDLGLIAVAKHLQKAENKK